MAKTEKDPRLFGRKGFKRALRVRFAKRLNAPEPASPESMQFTSDSKNSAVIEAESIVEDAFLRGELYRADVLAQRDRRRRIVSTSVGIGVLVAGVSLVVDLIATSNPSTVLIQDGSNVVTTIPCPDLSGTFVCPGGGRVTVGTGNNEGYLQVSTPASGVDRIDRSLNIHQEFKVQETDTSIIAFQPVSQRRLPRVVEESTGKDGVTVFAKPDSSWFSSPCVKMNEIWSCYTNAKSSNDQVTAFSGGNVLQLRDTTSTVPVLTDIPVRIVEGKTVESYLKDDSTLILDIGKNGAITNVSLVSAAAFMSQP